MVEGDVIVREDFSDTGEANESTRRWDLES
jgi:hypothetical protein